MKYDASLQNAFLGTARPSDRRGADGLRSENAIVVQKTRVFLSGQKARPQWLEHSPWMAPSRSVVLGSNSLPDLQIRIGSHNARSNSAHHPSILNLTTQMPEAITLQVHQPRSY